MKPVFPAVMILLSAPVVFAQELSIVCSAAAPPAPAVAAAAEPAHVDVVFCIDRSHSMNDVIETAKRKVWSIVNEIAKAKPTPVLRIGLVGYGDGERLLHRMDLTDDLDEVYKQLMTYRDDSPSGQEFVGHAIHVADREMKWSSGSKTLKIIYVIGNETAKQGPEAFDYTKTAPAAIAKGIMVNAIYCGQYERNTAPPTWREFAKLADGQFLEIAGDGGRAVAAIATPFDAELAALNGKLNKTYVAYGARGGAGAANQVAQDAAAAGLSTSVLAERAAAKATPQYSNSVWDLVDASKKADFDLKKIEEADLPDEVRKLDAKDRPAFIERKAKERAEIQKSIGELSAKRDAYVKAEETKAQDSAPADSFDAAVRSTLRQQAQEKGFAFDK
jgi:hypothetical protein